MKRIYIFIYSTLASLLLVSCVLAEVFAFPYSLRVCLDLGISNNVEVQQAREDLNRSQWQINVAKSALFPRVSVDYGFVHAHSQQSQLLYSGMGGMIKAAVPGAPVYPMPDFSDVYSLKFSAQQLIFGGQVVPALAMAEANRLAAQANLNLIRVRSFIK